MLKKMTFSVIGNFLSLGISVIVGFLITPFIIGKIGGQGYGTWMLLNSIVTYFTLLSFGIDSAIRVFVAKHLAQNDHQKASQVVSTAMILLLSMGIIGIVLTFVLQGWITSFFDIDRMWVGQFKDALVIVGISASITLPCAVYTSIFTAAEDFNLVNKINIFSSLMRCLCVFIFLKQGMGLYGVALAFLIENIFRVAISIIVKMRHYKFIEMRIHWIRKSVLLSTFSFGLGTILIIVADMLRFNLDSFVIAKYIDVKSVGQFSIAVILISHILGLVNSIFKVLNPRFASLCGMKDDKKMVELLQYSNYISSIMGLGGFLMVYLFAGSVIYNWVGPDFMVSTNIVVVLMISYSIAFIQNPSINLLYALNKHRSFAKITMIEAVVNVVLSIILVQKYGLMGVAIGTVIPMFIVKAFLQPLIVIRALDITLYQYIKPTVKIFGMFVLIMTMLLIKGIFPENILVKTPTTLILHMIIIISSLLVLMYLPVHQDMRVLREKLK